MTNCSEKCWCKTLQIKYSEWYESLKPLIDRIEKLESIIDKGIYQMNKNAKYSELLGFVARVANGDCYCSEEFEMECLSCPAIELLRKVMREEEPLNKE